MSTARITTQYRIAGRVVEATVLREDETASTTQVALPAGLAGVLTTRTGDAAGTVTVAEGHGITTSDKVSVFWSGGAAHGLSVGSTTGTTVVVATSAIIDGAVLPAQDTVVVIAKAVETTFTHEGNDIAVFVAFSRGRLSVVVADDAPASVYAADIPADESVAYIEDFSIGTNPFAGDTLTQVVLANGSTSAQTAEILTLKNAI
jgi:hypothetical protein